MTSASTTKREAVATAIRTGVEALDGGWAAYASPVDITSLPCVVLGPGDPYREQSTFGGFSSAHETMHLIAHLFINRATGNTALDMFDTAADAVLTALDTVTDSTQWGGMRLLGNVDANGYDALAAAIDIEVI